MYYLKDTHMTYTYECVHIQIHTKLCTMITEIVPAKLILAINDVWSQNGYLHRLWYSQQIFVFANDYPTNITLVAKTTTFCN